MEFYGLPPIGQKQRRPMDGAQFHPLWVGEAGGRLKRGKISIVLQVQQSKRKSVFGQKAAS
jgi:hypothetical protein